MKVPMRSIRSQLLTGLLAIIVVSGAVAFFTNTFWAHRALDDMVQSNDRKTAAALSQSLAETYRTTRSWTKISDEVKALKDRSPDLFRHDELVSERADGIKRGRVGREGDIPLIVADRKGNKVFDGLDHGDPGTRALAREKMDTSTAQAVSVDGQVVGFLQFKSMIVRGLGPSEQAFLDTMNVTLASTLTLQVLIALALGLVLSSRFVRPIRLLEGGVKRIAEGRSREHVAVSGANEISLLAQDFNRMVDQLKAQEQSRRNLFADVAHELRTPVSILQANLEMMIEGVYPIDRERLSSLHEETRLLAKLIADLRTISDLELDIVEVSLESLPLGLLVSECTSSYQPFFDQQRIELRTLVDPGTLTVQGDPHRLAQVMANLLENALRYAPESPFVEVLVQSIVPGADAPAVVRVSVNDLGPGVTDLEIPRIFDRFYRTELSRNRKKGGRGLGLAIVKQMIEACGGRVGASRRQPQGLSVWFELPAEEASANAR